MKELLKALAKFQQEVPIILKEEEGYGYKFANWKSIMDTIKPLLQKHNLGFWQGIKVISGGGEVTIESYDKVSGVLTKSKKTSTKNDNVLTTTVFLIDSDEQIYTEILIPNGVELAKMNDFQVLGSGLSYLKRYSLSNILGLITDKDDDGSNNSSNATQVFNWVGYFDANIKKGGNTELLQKTLLAQKKNISEEEFTRINNLLNK